MPIRLPRFARGLLTLSLLLGLLAWLGGIFLRSAEAAPQEQLATSLVISEFRTTGPNGGNDEFIEIYNPTEASIPLGGLRLRASSGCGTTLGNLHTFAAVSLEPHRRYLVAGSTYSGSVLPDVTTSLGIADTGGIALTYNNSPTYTVIDQVGMCEDTTYREGTALVELSGTSDQSYERIGNGCIDANDNSIDFTNISPSSPQNSASLPLPCLYVVDVSSTTTDGYYTTNAVIAVTVQFSSNVNVTGTPVLQLETGLQDGFASYASGSGTDTLTFNYIVQAGDASADLDYLGADALSLNGGTIIGAVGGASLALPSPSGPNSLSANKNIVLDNLVDPYVVSFTRQAPIARITNSDTLTFRAIFSEPVVNVDAGDFIVNGVTGYALTFLPVEGNVYDIQVSSVNLGNLNGVVSLNLVASPSIVDTMGEVLTGTEPLIDEDYLVDNILPTVTVNQASGQADPAAGPPVDFTVVFSEPIDTATFTVADIHQMGTILSSLITWEIFDMGDHKTFTLSAVGIAGVGGPTSTLQPVIDSNMVADIAGNTNLSASSSVDNAVTYGDEISPSVTVNRARYQAEATSTLPIDFEVQFSEPIIVSIFTPSDITQEGTAPGVTWTITDSGDHMLFTLTAVTASASGTIIPTIAANRVTDYAGNNNTASTSSDAGNIVFYDITAPTVTVNQAAGQRDPATSLPIRFTVVFSEGINAGTFTVEDITQAGTAAVSAWSITDSGDHKTFTLSALGLSKNGTVTPSVAAGKVMDPAGNSNRASTSTDNTVTAPSVVPSFTPTRTPTRTPSRSPTPTGTRRTATPSPTPTLGVVISEIAWMGTKASSSDEWVELYNRGSASVDLSGWTLKSTDGAINIVFTSSDPDHTIAPGEYFILAPAGTFESVVINKNISTTFSNDGKSLELRNASGILIDTANASGGAWPAGVSSPSYYTMERHLVNFRDMSANWYTFGGTPTEKDADGNWIYGTPGYANWAAGVTATPSKTPSPTRTPTRKGAVIVTPSTTLVINEFMPRAGFDWNQDGKVDVFDEFIEIANLGPLDINLNGWKLDDAAGQGSSPYTIPSKTLKVGERIVFYASQTNILLSDGGDTVRLMNPNNVVKDAQTYSVIKIADQSWCRLPDINGSWFMDCFPTPNQRNSRTGEVPDAPPDTGLETPLCLLPDTLPEDFRNAECYGFGSNMWQAMYWDLSGWFKEFIVSQGASKWDTFVE
ncbi:MAG: lamin tail domain-containing protein [Chloroflexi bacterium]|nr:lamin tail domain-containing protein [Chloroflexota bacterium]